MFIGGMDGEAFPADQVAIGTSENASLHRCCKLRHKRVVVQRPGWMSWSIRSIRIMAGSSSNAEAKPAAPPTKGCKDTEAEPKDNSGGAFYTHMWDMGSISCHRQLDME